MLHMVHLTRIYTKTGDAGTTALGNFDRVPKTDPRIVAYADTDECNAAVGVALALGHLSDDVRIVLRRIQNDLFDVGADLCVPLPDPPDKPALRMRDDYVERLEGWCDLYNARLAPLDSFILPGGSPGSALLHVARTVTRRAERSVFAALHAYPDGVNVVTARYLNRLSDLLFILCRVANDDGRSDVKWVPGGIPTA
jgi:cob(I)alamin adenosyltransferase